ncbi:MAG: hypothetical protein AAF519_15340 [Bacteroidota bacterium]
MKTRIYGTELEEIATELNCTHDFTTDQSTYLEREYVGDHLLFGRYKEIFFEGVHIGYGDLRVPNPTSIYFDTEGLETIEMHFALSGKARTNSNNYKEEIQFDGNQHNVFYAFDFKGTLEWCASKSVSVFEVNLWPSFFEKYLP